MPRLAGPAALGGPGCGVRRLPGVSGLRRAAWGGQAPAPLRSNFCYFLLFVLVTHQYKLLRAADVYGGGCPGCLSPLLSALAGALAAQKSPVAAEPARWRLRAERVGGG